MQNMLGNNLGYLRFRKANLNDELLYLQWANDPVTRALSINSKIITPDEHHQWFTKNVENPDNLMLVFSTETSDIGQVRIEKKQEAIISISIDKRERGKGYAVRMIRESILEYHKLVGKDNIIAFIKKQNDASISAFKKNGFIMIEENVEKGLDKYILYY